MKVRVEGDNFAATVEIVLNRQDLVLLSQLVACGGSTAGATAPTSPLRDAAFKICQKLFRPESSQKRLGSEVAYRLARG